MSIRPQTLLAFVAVVSMAAPARAIDFIGRTPESYECQAKASAVLGKLAAKVTKCRDRGLGATCINETTDEHRERLEQVLGKFFEKVSPIRCVTGVCGREDTAAECTATILDGPGHPDDGIGELGFKCLEKTSKLLVKFSRAASKCKREDAKAVANGEPSNLDPCLNLRALENVGGLVSVLEKHRDKGGSPNDCGVRGECTVNDDTFRCADSIMSIALEEAKLGAIGDSGDVEGRIEACREAANDILLDLAKGAGDCREEEAKALRGGGTFDLTGCLEQQIDRWAEKLAGILTKASEKGVGSDRCIPNSCGPEDNAGVCARTALEDIAGL